MGIIQVLKEDHAFFRDRFQQIKTLSLGTEIHGDDALILALVKEFRKRHKIHIRRETELLIPALMEAYRKTDVKVSDEFLLFHLREEHLSVGRSIYLLEKEMENHQAPSHWISLLDSLTDIYLPHMDREENALFPEAEKFLTSRQLEILANFPVGQGN